MPNATRLGATLNQINEGGIRIQPSEYTPWLDQQAHTIASDPTIPNAPTLTATAADQSIDLEITRPATNTDGSVYLDHKHFVVYYSLSSGIDVSDPLTYSGSFETTSTRHTHATESKMYFRAVCKDMHGNTSAASAEVNATPTSQETPPAVDDYANNIANVYVGKGMIGVLFQPPKSTWVRYAAWKLYFDTNTGAGWTGIWTGCYTGAGPGFLHKGLNESYKYKYRLTVLAEDGTETVGTVSDNSGSGYQPNQSDNSTLLAVTIFAERIIASSEMIARTFIGGKFQSTNWGSSAGSLWDADAGTIKLGGSSAPKFQVATDGALTATSATISGAITASSGTIGGFTIGASSLTAGSSGTAVGLAPGSYPFYAGSSTASSAPFRVSNSGAVTCSNITITGGSVSGSTVGSGLSASNITTGTLTGRVVRTASSGARAEMNPSGAGGTHGFAIYNSSGKVTAWMLDGQLVAASSSGYNEVALYSTINYDPPQLRFGRGSGTIYSEGTLLLEADDVKLKGHTYFPGGTGYNWYWNGSTYSGSFYTPAGGIYVYIGGNRYAIPYYGPV